MNTLSVFARCHTIYNFAQLNIVAFNVKYNMRSTMSSKIDVERQELNMHV